MPTQNEYREFFLRATKIITGSKADQETNYPTQYMVTDLAGNQVMGFNRFLKNHFPSEDVFKKLFESITFKLNPEDTASQSVQGLVRIITGHNIVDRLDSITESGETFTTVVVPSSLPVVAAGSGITVDVEIVRASDDAVVMSIPPGDNNIYYLRYTVNAVSGITNIQNTATDVQLTVSGAVQLPSGSVSQRTITKKTVVGNTVIAKGDHVSIDIYWERDTSEIAYRGDVSMYFGSNPDSLQNHKILNWSYGAEDISLSGKVLFHVQIKLYRTAISSFYAVTQMKAYNNNLPIEASIVPFGVFAEVRSSHMPILDFLYRQQSQSSLRLDWSKDQIFEIVYDVKGGNPLNFEERFTTFIKTYNN